MQQQSQQPAKSTSGLPASCKTQAGLRRSLQLSISTMGKYRPKHILACFLGVMENVEDWCQPPRYRLVGVTSTCFIEGLWTRLWPDHNVATCTRKPGFIETVCGTFQTKLAENWDDKLTQSVPSSQSSPCTLHSGRLYFFISYVQFVQGCKNMYIWPFDHT